MPVYPFHKIEKKWQAHWAEEKTFRTPDEPDPSREKFYVLDMFPYPSGAGLHVGHPEGYTATDITARYKRMRGFNVLHPMGWDAFGLPAEQYAVETGTHPRETTYTNIGRFREQLQSLGFSYDWDREISTTDEDYFKWTQWIFLKLYEQGLAYQAEVAVNWCPELGTVLANEEVIDGKSERGGHPVVRKPMKQWMLKITAYAERLLADLEPLEWSDSIKEMQRNWIGRSEGAEVEFRIPNLDFRIKVFTTRPDTLFGATYMVLAPEHELVDQITTPEHAGAVKAYREAATRKSDLERTELQKEKTGVFTGSYATNPVNGEEIPVWIADYVLSTYGTGAIMSVPGHDERDYEFAKAFDLPIVEVISGGDLSQEAYTGDGTLVNSSSERVSIDGLPVAEATAKMIAWLEQEGLGEGRVNYKLRDWLFSRQRYWGEPFPVIFVDGEPRVLPETELPVTLPEVDSYKASGTGESPLATIDSWLQTTDPATGEPAVRETNTMPQWAGSCWYYLRFIDPKNPGAPVDPEKEKYWMPVDLYVGGAEHAVLHLLYARFWHKVLYDVGVVSTPEPFRKLVNQGMILGEVEYTLDGKKLSEDEVTKKGYGFVLKNDPAQKVDARAFKMSKSRGNVINPDDVVRDYGADSLRLYEMFMGPLEQTKPWSMHGVEGVHRFLNRVWRIFVDDRNDETKALLEEEPTREQLRMLHITIKKVTEDVERMHYNTAISAMMEFVNASQKWEGLSRALAEPFILVLSPFAPHLAEELWSRLGHEESLAYVAWPAFDEAALVEDEVELVVQVNGKVRGRIRVAPDASQEDVLALAKGTHDITRHLEGKTLRKEIVVPGKLVNLVVG